MCLSLVSGTVLAVSFLASRLSSRLVSFVKGIPLRQNSSWAVRQFFLQFIRHSGDPHAGTGTAAAGAAGRVTLRTVAVAALAGPPGPCGRSPYRPVAITAWTADGRPADGRHRDGWR